MNNIRNFSIIAHIDHGKSTLADRIISECGAVDSRVMSAQVMDTMDIEKERGITIKAQSVRLTYKLDGQIYILNLIDTPGHVDFSYEVSRSLASCEGALLVVDASQGVEAQTIANVYIALENNLEIIPVINKIDLPAAEPQRVKDEIEHIIGLDCSEAIEVSAKTGVGIKELIETIIRKIPPPKPGENRPFKSLIYDSWFDNYLGALALVRVYDGAVKKGDEVYVMGTDKKHTVLDLMYPNPIAPIKTDELKTGEVGIIVLGLKNVSDVSVGDTITLAKNRALEAIGGFEKAKPFVFAGLYPIDTDKFEDLRDALDKLKLNDSSISYEPETSAALGFGFRVGFLGLLHMEVVKERLEREFGLDLIATAPTVTYEVVQTDGVSVEIQNPSELPPVNKIEFIKEPYVKATIITPTEFLGNIITLLNNRRGVQTKMDYITTTRVLLEYDIPMNEIVMDFYDKLKSATKGYASFDYEPSDYRVGNLVKLDIKVAGETVDALSIIVPEEKAMSKGRDFVKTMKELVPRQLFEVAIQASIGNKVIARETVKSMGKNVTAKCYGGDITRKRKLLEKQKEGKKRMKAIGKVTLPQEAFLSVLKID
ncbi:elongation factor 4 [Campylobacter hyointestinalis subsp. hyointestinalis]|uniref:Elongation factor 4 n=1 Tax=Campylobacter hyointestinalis subsp. hyointestinalis TaxID=91352 RepID=A0A9W5AN87_CAMHY|nr:translation elongation factor 4 [Campylobacter hyointestinalis]PPB58290.1 elongation factor 4 [Campylobacter hyointestinalis subsp. hyointestinalis]QCU00500.1 elongation factor 4 [Campylobacter hyointestinalis subsp. hyointestinalis]TWO22253.1 elongation factor 4 [Campylobacter hyointestinalis]CUU69451.1 GTP-binding protein LepA [Campylobacter hyointestinalis subsp. hyointestinalis]CUU72467.1 GTP-binding protein LepA [Campylobacter hyointestinalis subsp. hyointestinalis]